MLYKHRELRRLWRLEVFDPGDHNAPDAPKTEATVVAWNQVEATRSAGGEVVAMPESLHFVTFADDDGNIFRIDDPNVGPVGDPIKPTITPPELTEEDWK